MKIFLLAECFAIIALAGCASGQNAQLRRALSWQADRARIEAAFGQLGNNSGEDKATHLRQTLGDDNLTCFLLTILWTMSADAVEGYDIKLKGDGAAVAQRMAAKLTADLSLVSLDDVRGLRYTDHSANLRKGMFTIDNDCVRGTVVFLADKNKNGEVVLMGIPQADSKVTEGMLVAFDKRRRGEQKAQPQDATDG